MGTGLRSACGLARRSSRPATTVLARARAVVPPTAPGHHRPLPVHVAAIVGLGATPANRSPTPCHSSNQHRGGYESPAVSTASVPHRAAATARSRSARGLPHRSSPVADSSRTSRVVHCPAGTGRQLAPSHPPCTARCTASPLSPHHVAITTTPGEVLRARRPCDRHRPARVGSRWSVVPEQPPPTRDANRPSSCTGPKAGHPAQSVQLKRVESGQPLRPASRGFA